MVLPACNGGCLLSGRRTGIIGVLGRVKGWVRETTPSFVVPRMCHQQIDAKNPFVVVHDVTVPKSPELERLVFTLIQRAFFQFFEKVDIPSCNI